MNNAVFSNSGYPDDASSKKNQNPSSPATNQNRAGSNELNVFKAGMQEHKICMVIPAGSTVDANALDLPGGILILGRLRGRVNCETGSAIIAKEGEFQGSLEANDVLVEGKITSAADSTGKITLSIVKARGQRNSQGKISGGIVALSDKASVCARMDAVAFQIPRSADLNRSVLQTIV